VLAASAAETHAGSGQARVATGVPGKVQGNRVTFQDVSVEDTRRRRIKALRITRFMNSFAFKSTHPAENQRNKEWSLFNKRAAGFLSIYEWCKFVPKDGLARSDPLGA